jgi:hypothetical protein
MKSVSIGKKEILSVQNTTVFGVTASLKVTHASANTALAINDFDLSKIRVNVLLHRNNSATTIMNGDLATLLAYCTYNEDALSAVLDGSLNLLTPKGGVVKEVAQIPVNLHWGGVIDLVGEDKLEISFDMGDNFAGANVGDAVLEFTELEMEGVEVVTPTIQIHTLTNNNGVFQSNLGNQVKNIMFVSRSASDSTEAQKVLNNVTLTSAQHKKAVNLNWRLLSARRFEDLYSSVSINARKQNFLLHGNAPISGVDLQLDLVSEKVIDSKNYVVFYKGDYKIVVGRLLVNALGRWLTSFNLN